MVCWTEAGVAPAPAPRLRRHICPVCKTEFLGVPNRKYCSDACRQEAYRQRQQRNPLRETRGTIQYGPPKHEA